MFEASRAKAIERLDNFIENKDILILDQIKGPISRVYLHI
jgi:hypothetical protein